MVAGGNVVVGLAGSGSSGGGAGGGGFVVAVPWSLRFAKRVLVCTSPRFFLLV